MVGNTSLDPVSGQDELSWTWSRLSLLASSDLDGIFLVCQILYPDAVTVHANESILLSVVRTYPSYQIIDFVVTLFKPYTLTLLYVADQP